MLRSIRQLLLPFAAAALLAGCHDNPAPDKDNKPAAPVGNTDLRDAIQKPINKAKGVDDQIENEKKKQDKQIQDAGG